MIDIDCDLIGSASFSPLSVDHPNAWVGHLPFAAWLMKCITPNLFVELGTHSGNSYFSFCQAVSEAGLDTKCCAVDSWLGEEHAGFYSEAVYQKVYDHNQKYYAGFSRLMRMNFDEALNYFSEGSIDLLHIDGLHSYEAVKHDFESWLPKLAPSAVVLFHDTMVREKGFGVWKLWEELKENYSNNFEFTHSHGLGVMQLDGGPEVQKLKWLHPASPDQKKLKNYFSALGIKQLERFELAQLTERVNDLNQAVSAQNGQIQDLNQAVAERDGQIEELNQAVAERDSQIEGLNQAVAERDGQIEGLNQVVAERDGQLVVLLSSRSLRLTSPLRSIGQQLRRFKMFCQLASNAVRRKGGAINAAIKALKVLRHEGWLGVRQRIRSIHQSENQPAVIITDGQYVDRNDYAEWIRRYDTLTNETRSRMRDGIENFVHKPLISVVMPTYNPKPEWLVEAIESVRGQIYPNWELCIADDASTDDVIRPILERYVREDSRIKVVFREQNGHISASSNSALELAKGEYVALLDHDDLLAEHALFWVADAINHHPDAQLLYSDEDKIDDKDQRSHPYFKCDWNLDLFYSHNLICHLGVYKKSLIREVGGFREGFEGAQDYDLALRCIERLDEKEIVHITRVLYHWRIHPESTASASEAKPYALLAGQKALNEHLARKGVAGQVELLDFGMYRVRYDLPDRLPLVSLIIPTRNAFKLVHQCVESILEKTSYPEYEIIIVDNGSDDVETLRYFEELESDTRVRVLRDDRPFNYSALNNAAVRVARGELVCLLNNDIEVITPDWLTEMVGIALQPCVGAVGARLWYPNNTLQHGGVILGIGGVAGHAHKHLLRGQHGYFGRAALTHGVSVVTAACLVICKNIYEEVGGLNEVDLQVAFNDVDFCLRICEAGFRNVWTPYADLYHHESATRGYENTPEKQKRFAKETQYMQRRWECQLLNDPAYNPNLTLDYEDFSLAWPPRVESLSG